MSVAVFLGVTAAVAVTPLGRKHAMTWGAVAASIVFAATTFLVATGRVSW